MTTYPTLSPIIAGCWRMDSWQQNKEQRLSWIEQCLELSITSFDHADIYGGYSVQTMFGQALALKPSLRQKIQLISKAGICLLSPKFPQRYIKHYDSSAAYLIASAEQSLRDLGTDYLDVLLIHRPDHLSDWDEIAQVFDKLHRAGKVRSFGVSNFSVGQFAALNRRIPLISNQIEFSPLQLQALNDDTLLQAQELKARPMIWSPLAGGRLFKTDDVQAVRVHAVLQQLAQEMQVSVATIAYAWILRHPSRPLLITGTQRPEGLREALAAEKISLSRQQWTQIWEASVGYPVA